MPQDPIVVVGGGLAAGKAAESLRAEGYDGDLVVVSSEPHRPYERPPLSTGVTGDRVQAGMAVNTWEQMGRVEEIVRAGGPVDREAQEAFSA